MAAHILGHHAERAALLDPDSALRLLARLNYCSISAHLRGAHAHLQRPLPRRDGGFTELLLEMQLILKQNFTKGLAPVVFPPIAGFLVNRISAESLPSTFSASIKLCSLAMCDEAAASALTSLGPSSLSPAAPDVATPHLVSPFFPSSH